MIFYFSGTGNTRWAAIRLASATRERLVSITDQRDTTEPFVLQEGERLGFVFPVHGWRVPRLVRRFIGRLRIEAPARPFTYCVCTAGDSIGLTVENLNDTLARNDSLRRIGVTAADSSYSLIMPESYVGLPFMDVDPKDREKLKKDRAAGQLLTVTAEILQQQKGVSRVTKGPLPWFFTHVVGGFFEHVLITDKRFHVTDGKCVKCGICANVCPVGDIRGGQGQKPEWLHHDDCLTCFTCYHHCPHHAIEFGRQTQRKGQYFYK